MTDTTTAPSAPATGAPAAPPADPATPAPAAPTASATEPVIEDPKAVLDALKKANDEAAKLRLQVKAFEDAKLTDEQRAAQELADAQAELVRVRGEADRAQVAAAKGVPLEVVPATGSKAEMEAAADAAIAWKTDGKPAVRPPAPNNAQGTTQAPGAQDPGSTFANFLADKLPGSQPG